MSAFFDEVYFAVIKFDFEKRKKKNLFVSRTNQSDRRVVLKTPAQ